MRRLVPVLRLALAVLFLAAGYALIHPSDSAASAYPTALQNFDAPTAWSSTCQFPQICHAGHSCWVGTDPFEGCKNNGRTCIGCYI